jgi:predicted heme/steroid binding protein
MAQLPYFATFTEDERLDTERRLVKIYKALSEKLTTLSGAVLTEIETGTHQQIHTLLTDLSDYLEVVEMESSAISEELSDIFDQYPARALNLASFTIKVREEIGAHIRD